MTVPLDTLAHFWEAQGLGDARIAFMKIDVEGFEYFVLKGAGDAAAPLRQHAAGVLARRAWPWPGCPPTP